MKKCWVNDFLSLSPKERRKRKLNQQGMEKVQYAPRKEFSRDEVRLYLFKNSIFNLTQLRKREHMKDCPSYYFIRKYWGNFEKYRKSIGIKNIQQPKPTDIEVLKVLSEYQHIRTLKQYLDYRKTEPCLFVSRREIRKRFGNWKNCRRLADAYNKNSIIERYIKFKNQLGRTPSKKEAIANGIELMNLKVPYREFKKFIWMLENPRKFLKRATA